MHLYEFLSNLFEFERKPKDHPVNCYLVVVKWFVCFEDLKNFASSRVTPVGQIKDRSLIKCSF